ncbi:hypothetical protein niasHT_002151 [Heterodera trifolii]|uniref:Uncharacterized protein n=1 Tax=Heterodera trifolii TaxID=157864 RepID=A0ABD2LX34_9BILA
MQKVRVAPHGLPAEAMGGNSVTEATPTRADWYVDHTTMRTSSQYVTPYDCMDSPWLKRKARSEQAPASPRRSLGIPNPVVNPQHDDPHNKCGSPLTQVINHRQAEKPNQRRPPVSTHMNHQPNALNHCATGPI